MVVILCCVRFSLCSASVKCSSCSFICTVAQNFCSPCVMCHSSFARSICFILNFHVDQLSPPLSLAIDHLPSVAILWFLRIPSAFLPSSLASRSISERDRSSMETVMGADNRSAIPYVSRCSQGVHYSLALTLASPLHSPVATLPHCWSRQCGRLWCVVSDLGMITASSRCYLVVCRHGTSGSPPLVRQLMCPGVHRAYITVKH